MMTNNALNILFLVFKKQDTNGLVDKRVSCGARRPGFKSRWEQCCFGFVRWGMMRLGVGEIGSTGGEIQDGFCHFFIENAKKDGLENLQYLKLFLIIEIYRKCLKSTKAWSQ